MPVLKPVAIVGVSALFPGSMDKRGFWRDILRGRDLIEDVPQTHWLLDDYYDPDPQAEDKTYSRRGAFLKDVEFEPVEYGIPPNIMECTDTAQLLAMVVARRLLDDAYDGPFEEMDRSRMGVILGMTSTTELCAHMSGRLQKPVWEEALRRYGLEGGEIEEISQIISEMYVPFQESAFPGLLGNVVAGRVANRFDLGGTNCVVDAACASSIAALEVGINQLSLGQADMVITGGVDAHNDILMYTCFSEVGAMSRSGHCRPFDRAADGTLMSEGVGMFALKRLEDAERDNDEIYAVIRGVGSSSDGRAKSIYAPRPQGQSKALQRAYDDAGYSPRTVELVEAHGTATKAGDAAEVQGLKEIFSQAVDDDTEPWCALGSVKSQLGHAKAAAGAAGLFKAVMALHNRVLPPTINVDTPNPALELESSPFFVNSEARPWIRDASHPRRVGVSSFGFGGTNSHVTVEEYTGEGSRAGRQRALPAELVVLSADDPEELVRRCRQLVEELSGEGLLAVEARRSQEDFEAHRPARVAVVAEDTEDLRTRLERAASTIEANPKEVFSSPGGIHYGCDVDAGQVGVLFPGQGSQYVGMSGEWAMHFDICRQVWDRATGVELEAEEKLHQVVFPPPAFSKEDKDEQQRKLTRTQWAQPALGVASLSVWRLLEKMGLESRCMGGHSYGEITALAAAGGLEEEALIRVSRKRGELMAAASEVDGAMTAVRIDRQKLESLLDEWEIDVVLANHNGPNQCVLSGTTEAIEEAEKKLEGQAMSFRRLSVSTAFHSPVVSSSEKPFSEALEEVDFGPLQCRVYANSKAEVYPEDPEQIRKVLAGQLARPVRFVEQVRAMYDEGVRTFLEVGPANTLTNLVGRCLEDRPHHRIGVDQRGTSGTRSLMEAIGYLATRGVDLDYGPLWEGYADVPDPTERKKSGFAVEINGANYNKPYPSKHPRPEPKKRIKREPKRKSEISSPSSSSASGENTRSQGSTSVPAMNGAQETMTNQNDNIPPAMSQSPRGEVSRVNKQRQGQDPVRSESDDAWVEAFSELQRQTAQTQRAFLETMNRSFAALERMAGAGSTAASGESFVSRAEWSHDETGADAPPEMASTMGTGGAEPAASEPVNGQRAKNGRKPTAGQMPHATAPSLAPAPALGADVAPPPAAPQRAPATTETGEDEARDVDMLSVLLEVVGEKTGYPVEMLEPEMELESDLGVDSIKQVEIMAQMQEKLPQLPDVEAGDLVDLHTLQAIADFLESLAGEKPAAPQIAKASRESTNTGEAVDVEQILMSVVAEKTGYPTEMLEPEMELESDLGVDSIKQVEIMSQMEDQFPELPSVEAADLADLRTIGEIASHLEGVMGGRAPRRQSKEKKASEEGSDDDSESDPGADGIERYVVRPEAAPACGWAMPGVDEIESVHVVGGPGEVSAKLVDALKERGLTAERVERAPDDSEAAIYLGALEDAGDAEEVVQIGKRGLQCARALTMRDGAPKLFVTVQATGGSYAPGSNAAATAWTAGGSALAKTAAAEWPEAATKAIDLRVDLAPQEQAEAIVTEILSGGPQLEVGIGEGGRRITPVAKVEPVARDGAPEGLEEGSVIVVSGGAKGVTATSIIELGREVPLRFVLLGRTTLTEEPKVCRGIDDVAGLNRALLQEAKEKGQKLSPRQLRRRVKQILSCREIRATVDALEAAGCEVRYASADVCDEDRITEIVDDVRKQWGPIKGLVHGAGVLADSRICDKSDEQFDVVFRTKVDGLRALLEATAQDPLELLCLFSSVAARTGNPGQADYAMANEVLNKVAHAEAARRGPGCRVKSLGWGPWDGGMVDEALKEHFERQGVVLLPPTIGAQMFVDEVLYAAAQQVEVVLGGAPSSEGINGAHLRGGISSAIEVSASTHPYLDGHRLRGGVVLPAMLAMEWFLRFARGCCPGLRVQRCRDLKVQSGVKIGDFDNGGQWLKVRAEAVGDGPWPQLSMELVGEGDVVHYAAVVEMGPTRPEVNCDLHREFDVGAVGELSEVGDVYGPGKLFHAEPFEVIRQWEYLGDEGAVGVVDGLRAMGWPEEFWQLDPAACDGGLQIGLLWGLEQIERQTLPMRVGECIPLADKPVDAEIVCHIKPIEVGKQKIFVDLLMTTPAQRPLGVLRGVEMFAVPEGI